MAGKYEKIVSKPDRPRCKDGSLDMRFSVNKGLDKHGFPQKTEKTQSIRDQVANEILKFLKSQPSIKGRRAGKELKAIENGSSSHAAARSRRLSVIEEEKAEALEYLEHKGDRSDRSDPGSPEREDTETGLHALDTTQESSQFEIEFSLPAAASFQPKSQPGLFHRPIVKPRIAPYFLHRNKKNTMLHNRKPAPLP